MPGDLRILNVEPTIFFVRSGGALRQQVKLTVENAGIAVAASLMAHAEGVDESLTLGTVEPGESACDVYLPDIRLPIGVKFCLYTNDNLQDEKTLDWKPQKHWEIYMVHFSHHDMGYSDMPANLFVEHTEFMDEVPLNATAVGTLLTSRSSISPPDPPGGKNSPHVNANANANATANANANANEFVDLFISFALNTSSKICVLA